MSKRIATMATATAIVFVFAAHLVAVGLSLDREPDLDESEHLHAGWLMHQGKHIYRDFVEDHSPCLFIVLKWLVPGQTTPEFPIADLRHTRFAHARSRERADFWPSWRGRCWDTG